MKKSGKKITETRHLAYEILLIFAAVLIFRSLWTLMDKVPQFHKNSYLAVMLVFGVLITLIALNHILLHKE